MVKLMLKYDYLHIVAIHDAFYRSVTLPKNISVAKKFINLSYVKYSPIQNPFIVHLQDKEHLALWFCKQTITAPIVIPESYLFYKVLKKEYKNAIIIMQAEPTVVMVIKDSLLNAVFLMTEDIESTILASEYSIEKIITLSKTQFFELKQEAENSLELKDIVRFSQITFDYKEIGSYLIDKFAYLFVFLMSLAVFTSYIQGYFNNKKIASLTDEYQKLKSHNLELKQRIKAYNNKVQIWQAFAHNELISIDKIAILSELHTIIKPNEKAIFQSIQMNGNTITIMLATDMNSIIFLNRLNAIKYFKVVNIKNSYKPRGKPKVIIYGVVLKDRKEL